MVHFGCQDLFNYCLLKVFQLMIRGIYRIFHRFVHKGRMHSYGCPDNAVPHKELLHRRCADAKWQSLPQGVDERSNLAHCISVPIHGLLS